MRIGEKEIISWISSLGSKDPIGKFLQIFAGIQLGPTHERSLNKANRLCNIWKAEHVMENKLTQWAVVELCLVPRAHDWEVKAWNCNFRPGFELGPSRPMATWRSITIEELELFTFVKGLFERNSFLGVMFQPRLDLSWLKVRKHRALERSIELKKGQTLERLNSRKIEL